MKLIPLSQGKFAQVDDEDYEWLMQWKWFFSAGYARRSVRHGRNGKQDAVLMHREIMKTPDSMQVDHKDMDGLNNQKTNLRNCTHRENILNRGRDKRNKSGYKGVFWESRIQKWRARITIHGTRVTLGYFHDPIEAAKVYDAESKKVHGEFAHLNFPDV